MIPTDLPPGTEIICIDDKSQHGPCPLKKGELYTVRGYSVTPSGDISVLLNEVLAPQYTMAFPAPVSERGFFRHRFRVLMIPKELTGILDQINNFEKVVVFENGNMATFLTNGNISIRIHGKDIHL